MRSFKDWREAAETQLGQRHLPFATSQGSQLDQPTVGYNSTPPVGTTNVQTVDPIVSQSFQELQQVHSAMSRVYSNLYDKNLGQNTQIFQQQLKRIIDALGKSMALVATAWMD